MRDGVFWVWTKTEAVAGWVLPKDSGALGKRVGFG